MKKYLMVFLVSLSIAGLVACGGNDVKKAGVKDNKAIESVQKNGDEENEIQKQSSVQSPYSIEDIEALFASPLESDLIYYESEVDSGGTKVYSKNWVMKDMIKVETEGTGTILARDGKVYMYNHGKSDGIVLDDASILEQIKEASNIKEVLDFSTYKYISEEEIDGIDCIVFNISTKDVEGADTKFKVWMSKEWGFFVKYESGLNDGVVLEGIIKNISTEVSESDFELPKNITFKSRIE
jgi:hypothetical protein